ncbi:unnamed protein product [Penicillium salamii]|nr:unnamed protein product [Penicillium salamii]CAG8363385.1 unnamed protein product [Penicillium salamii]
MSAEAGIPPVEWGYGGIGEWIGVAARQYNHADRGFHAGAVVVVGAAAEPAVGEVAVGVAVEGAVTEVEVVEVVEAAAGVWEMG